MSAKKFILGCILFILIIFTLDRIVGLVLEYGIYKYFDLHSKVDFLVIGSSPATLDIDKTSIEKLTGKKFAFYAQQGATSEDRLIMIKHFLSVNKSKLIGIIYELTPHIFTCKGLSENSYQLLYPYVEDSVIHRYLKEKTGSKIEFLLREIMITPRYNDATLNFAIRGLMNNHRNLKYGIADTNFLQSMINSDRFWKITIDSSCLETFQKTVGYLNTQQVKVIYLFYPIIDVVTKEQEENVLRVELMVRSNIPDNRNISLISLTHLFDKNSSYFFDHLHLNKDGQNEFTVRFAQIIRDQDTLKR